MRFEIAASAVPRITHSSSLLHICISVEASLHVHRRTLHPAPDAPFISISISASICAHRTPKKVLQIERVALRTGITAFRGVREMLLWPLDGTSVGGAGNLAEARHDKFCALADLKRACAAQRVVRTLQS